VVDKGIEAELTDILNIAYTDIPELQANTRQAERDFALRAEQGDKPFAGGLYRETGDVWDELCAAFADILSEMDDRLFYVAQALKQVVTNYIAADQSVLQRHPELVDLLN
jgi:hypothetical protein